TKHGKRVLPLPKGEGRGEGEGRVRRQCREFIIPLAVKELSARFKLHRAWRRKISAPPACIGFKRPEGRAPLRAFTLIEMMTVLVLIGILSAMVIPEMKGTFEDALLRSTGRELMDVMELASSRAISLNQTLRIHLEPTTGRYQVERLKRSGILE